jgi:glycosyltransferase involved in cell wall biosynthesis
VIFNILVVNSASNDGTTEIVNQYVENYGVKHILLPENLGIGHAINVGIKSINSDYTIFFPSDAEYGVDAIYNSVELLNKSTQDKIFFGSRNISNYSKNRKFLFMVYDKNVFLRTLSRIGGIFITQFVSIRIGTWITDPLTSIKAANTSTLKKLDLGSTNFSYHGEIIRKAKENNLPIQEFSVSYSPRSYKNGKKIRIRDGVLIILAILGLTT